MTQVMRTESGSSVFSFISFYSAPLGAKEQSACRCPETVRTTTPGALPPPIAAKRPCCGDFDGIRDLSTSRRAREIAQQLPKPRRSGVIRLPRCSPSLLCGCLCALCVSAVASLPHARRIRVLAPRGCYLPYFRSMFSAARKSFGSGASIRTSSPPTSTNRSFSACSVSRSMSGRSTSPAVGR